MVEALALAAIGLLAGIIVNILADRLPIGLGLGGLWVCPDCQASLPASKGVGLIRELWRSQFCPACQKRLPRRPLAVEIALAMLFGFLWLRYGASPELALNGLYGVFVALIFVVDLEHRLVLNVVILPACVFALLTAMIRPGLAPALIGAAIAFSLLLAFHLIYPKGLGFGDVKLAAFLGLLLGWPAVLPGLFLGFAFAALISTALLATKRAGLKTYIPYAPFLVAGAYLVLLFPVGY